MSAQITVTRSPELRGRHGTYDIAIDGTSIGSLHRGQSVTHQVAAGEHTVTVTRDAQHSSPRHRLTVTDDDHVTLYASFISERAAYVRSPTKPSDYIVLTTDGSISNADGTAATPRETRTRIALLAVALLALVVSLTAPPGPLKQISYILWITATAVGFVLLIRHMRHLYRSPR